ncbi:MAG: response regulator [Pigmentiphaga sp.]|nr:response regulator [Pigmentiphaga sp.]
MTKKNTHTIFLLILYLCGTSLSTVAEHTYRFHIFSPEGGFYYDGITHIKQDLDGFMWVMMSKNLYRFDGYKHKHYYNSFEESESEKLFTGMVVDQLGHLFVSVSNGLYVYNKTTDSFFKLYEGTNLTFLKVDKENNLWLRDNGQFGIYNRTTNQFQPLIFDDKPLRYVNGFVPAENGFFLLVEEKKILRYSYETKKIIPFYTFGSKISIKGSCRIDNNLWLLSDDSYLYKIDIPTARLIEAIPMFKDSRKLLPRMIYADKNQNIWIPSIQGLYVFDTKTHTHQHYVHVESDVFSLPNNSVWVIEEDLQKNIWLGSYSGALAFVNLDDKNNFSFIAPSESGLNHNIVSAFAEGKDELWIATEGGGLNCMDKATKRFSYHTVGQQVNSIPSDNVKSIAIDARQNLWLATFRGGMSHFNPSTKKFINFKHDPKDVNSLKTNDLRKLLVEQNKGIWIAYQLPKLIISFYSFEDKTFTHHTLDETDDGYYIFDICHGSEDQLWIITHKKLYSLNTHTGLVKQMQYNRHYLEGQTLCVDGKENVWIGTIGRGLIGYDTQKDIFTTYTDILKFNVSSIFSICTDFEDNLWLGTDNGLFKFDTYKKIFYHFEKRDGVLCQVFQPLASYVNKDGKLYFGCTNGFAIVNSTDIENNQFQPKVIISDFFMDNVSSIPPVKDVKLLENTVSFPSSITLKYNESNFGFTFSCNNYSVPEKNRFKYRLKGYDDRWIEVDSYNRNVFYSKVPAGTYVFEVMASNNDGLWSKEIKQIQIKRLPAPWFTWWAYAIYYLLGAVIIFLVVRNYLNHRELKLKIYLDKLDKEKKEEIHQSQLRFFTNISHDFRTPLTLIIASVEKLRREGLREYYYRILHGNSQRLLGLVNELMDFRMVENNKMPLRISAVDVNLLIEDLAFDFDDYAKQRDISFEMIPDKRLPDELYVDRNIVGKISMNLLNNAFRYTPNGGCITIRTLTQASDFQSRYKNCHTVSADREYPDCFAIVVSDTGVGISSESIESVFERFYKTNTVNFDQHLGTGIGLALVKSLVLLHRGAITIYSERDKGSDFVIVLPGSSVAYTKEEIQPETLKRLNDMPEQSSEILLKSSTNEQDELTILTQEEEYKKKRTILVVEDNEDLRKLIADFLSSEYEVKEAENGVIASSVLDKVNVELIISDIMMPQKDGITLCQEVKNDINTSHIPFLLLTAKSGVESKLEGADSGADFYFEKPINLDLLLRTIKNIFQQQQKMREFYSKNYFADSYELIQNQRDVSFIKKFVETIDTLVDQSKMDINTIAYEMSMSRSKLYNKIKSITGKSIVEFILNHRLKKAAQLIIETDLTMNEIMDKIGIESQSYFTHSFKDEFGETPTAFAAKYKKK